MPRPERRSYPVGFPAAGQQVLPLGPGDGATDVRDGRRIDRDGGDADVDEVLRVRRPIRWRLPARADVVIEAVGVPETFELCTELVRPGGHVANVGVHGRPATLHLESLWIKNVTITTGLVDTYSTPTLLTMLSLGQLSTTEFVTHRFGLAEIMEAYDVFADAEDTGALKVALFRT